MFKQFLNSSDVVVMFKQMCGKTVPKRMAGNTLKNIFRLVRVSPLDIFCALSLTAVKYLFPLYPQRPLSLSGRKYIFSQKRSKHTSLRPLPL